MRIVGGLPAPLGPSTPYTDPRRTARSTPSTARTSPNVLTSPEASIARVEGVIACIDSWSAENSSLTHEATDARASRPCVIGPTTRGKRYGGASPAVRRSHRGDEGGGRVAVGEHGL